MSKTGKIIFRHDTVDHRSTLKKSTTVASRIIHLLRA